MEARSVLRQLLRAVDAHITRVAGNTQWRDYALQQFRANAAAQDAQLVQEQLQVARDYTFLINTVAHHRALLQKYNLGIDPDERSKQMVNAMARRMGFEMPPAHVDAPAPSEMQQVAQQQGQQPQQQGQQLTQQGQQLMQQGQQQQQQQQQEERRQRLSQPP